MEHVGEGFPFNHTYPSDMLVPVSLGMLIKSLSKVNVFVSVYLFIKSCKIILACYKILSTIDAVEKDRFFIVGSEDLFRRKRCEDKLYFS